MLTSPKTTMYQACPPNIDPGRAAKAYYMWEQGLSVNCDIDDDGLIKAVVASQGDPSLVYACVINSVGRYSCATNNLKACGGLRGQPCKHILVALFTLVDHGILKVAQMKEMLSNCAVAKPQHDPELTKTLIMVEQVKHRLQNKRWQYAIKVGK